MLPFWISDVVLISVQAALVAGPRPVLPAALVRARSSAWAWLLLPASLVGTVVLLGLLPAAAAVYAWVAGMGVPVLAAIAVTAALRTWRGSRPRWGRAVTGMVLAGAALAVAWAGDGLIAQGAAVALTAASASTLASYLTQLAPAVVLRAAVIVMAVLDAILVFGHLLQGPNNTLNAAAVPGGLPRFQFAHFGSAAMGYGDLFVAAVLGCLIATGVYAVPRWVGVGIVLAFSAVFDLLFFVVDTLPATVPVALALVVLEVRARKRRRRRS